MFNTRFGTTGYGYAHGRPEDVRDAVLNLTMQSTALAGIIALVTAILYPMYPILFFLIFGIAFVVEIITIIGYFFARKESTIRTLFYLFVVSSAILLGGTLAEFFSFGFIGQLLVAGAMALTAAIVGGIYVYVTRHNPNVSGLYKFLIIGGIFLIVFLVASFFISFGEIVWLVVSAFAAVLFSLYLLFDLSRLINQQFFSPSRMAWNLYWDILLIFRWILYLLYYLLASSSRK